MAQSNPSPPGTKPASSGGASISFGALELDCTDSGRQLWLVKVPKYVATAWESCEDEHVGEVQIKRSDVASKKHDITVRLNESVAKDFAKDFELNPQPIESMKMVAIAQNTEEPGLSMLGSVNRRCDLRPCSAGSAEYMNMKKKQIRTAMEPARKTQKSELKIGYKPISDHGKRLTAEEKEDKKVNKKLREDKDIVTEKIMSAFEKHQYINVKDLVEITNQPYGYVKELLNEYCDFNTKNPHRNMWELKPQYRHY